MSQNFEEIFKEKAKVVDSFIANYFTQLETEKEPSILELVKAMKYSTANGGKRFRPVLTVLAAEALNIDIERVLPFGMALEMIHTYSLIHDDLPCMDNDDERRGQPTNHKVFGEDFALLAGDSLLTEAFFVITEKYSYNPSLATKLVSSLAFAAGLRGMVGGQAIDLKAQKNTKAKYDLTQMHLLKTGALIKVAITGAALIADVEPQHLTALEKYGEVLGLSFQVADDLLDYDPKDPEPGSFPTQIGHAETKELMLKLSDKALSALSSFGSEFNRLRDLINYNSERSL